MPLHPPFRPPVLMFLLVFCMTAGAAEGAATVSAMVGEAWMETETDTRYALAEGQQVAPGSTVVTADGIVQLVFQDGGFMSIQKHTRLHIERFSFSGGEDGSVFSPNFVRRDGAPPSGDAEREDAPDAPAEGFARPEPALTADAAAGAPSRRVRVLSQPGEPLVIGSQADVANPLVRAAAAINGNVLEPIVSVALPHAPVIAARGPRRAARSRTLPAVRARAAVRPGGFAPAPMGTYTDPVKGAVRTRMLSRAGAAKSAVNARGSVERLDPAAPIGVATKTDR